MQNIRLSIDIQTVVNNKPEDSFILIQQAYEKAVKVSLKKIGVVNPNESINIICINAPERCIPEDGVSGYTVSSSLIYLYVDLNNINHNAIYSTICHELTHAKRFSYIPSYDGRLIASLVFEGIAVAFEDEIKDKNSEETFFLKTMNNRTNTERLLTIIQDDLFIPDYDFTTNYNKIFISGDKDKNLPRWAGYEIGYFLVKKYMKETGKKASDLVSESVDDLKKAIPGF